MPTLRGEAERVREPDEVLVDELFGRRYVIRGKWKLLWLEPPWSNTGWALYDLENDRAERNDVAAQNPTVVAELTAAWDAYAERVGVVLPNSPGL